VAVYEYRGINAKGKAVRGVQDADNVKALKVALKREGVFLTEAFEERHKTAKSAKTAKKQGGAGSSSVEIDFKRFFSRVKLMDVAILTRQIAVLLRAGIPLVEALAALTEQTEKEKLKRVVSQVKEQVNEGTSFADALAEHPKVFSSLYVNMVRAGESSGMLDVVLARLADFASSQVKMRGKLSSTMAYPAIMAVIGIGIVGFLFVYVIPKVTSILTDLEVALPLTTQILIAVSGFAGTWWWLLALLLFAAVYSFRRYIRSEDGRAWYDRTLLKLPVFGGVVRMMAVSRFAKTLGTMLTSGVPLLTAMDIVKAVVNNVVLGEVVENAREAIREGESIAEPLQRSGHFPPMVTHMIAVGERSGQLEEMLTTVADAYDTQVEQRLNALTSMLEPIMIVGMGGVVTFILFSILLPILRINEAIQ